MPSTTNDQLFRLLIIYAIWIAAIVFGDTFTYLYFKNAGVSNNELLFAGFFWCGAALLTIVLLNRKITDVRLLMIAGVIVRIAAYLALFIFTPTRELFFLYSFFIGITSFLFWVQFNTLYFELSRNMEAVMSTWYFSMSSSLSLFLPLAAAVVIDSNGFGMLFILTALIYAILVLAVTKIIMPRKQSYDIDKCLNVLKGFKTIIFIEGVYSGGILVLLPVITLLYLKHADELGFFFSITTIFAIFASFIVSRLSDASRKRMKYTTMFGGALAVATALATFAKSSIGWYSATSLRNFVSTLFYPFTTAIIVQSKERYNFDAVMVGRELILNAGRFFGIFIVLLCAVVLNDIHFGLMAMGITILTYPIVLELKKMHIKVE